MHGGFANAKKNILTTNQLCVIKNLAIVLSRVRRLKTYKTILVGEVMMKSSK